VIGTDLRVAGLVAGSCVALSSTGCDAGEGGQGLVTVRDSAGVRIVEHATALDAAPVFADVGEVELSIGVLEGAPEYVFGQIRGVRGLPDGGVVVVEFQDRTMRVYGPDGRHRFSMGGEGGGPGEFDFVDLAYVGPDGFYGFDIRTARVTHFDPQGRLVDVETFGQDPEERLTALYRLEDGTYLGRSRWRSGAPAPRPSGGDVAIVLDSLVLRRLDTGGATLDTVAVERDSHSLRLSFVVDGQQRGLIGAQPFGATTRWIAHPDGGVTLLLGPALELIRYGPSGETTQIVRVTGGIGPPDPVEVARLRERALDEAGDMASTLRDAIEKLYDEDNLPELRPIAGALQADPDGNYWVARYEPRATDVTDWIVFAPTGELLGSVTFPNGFTVHEIGPDWVLGVARDELDVQSVRRYALVPPA
jgi:hypothetical protein